MEIRDYLRAIRRVLPLLIILPIVAAVVTGFFIEKQPSKYQANASVVVPAISGNGTSQSAASQYASTFKDVIVSRPVIDEVSQKFKIPAAELLAGLSASTTTASSNIINVVLVGEVHQNLTGAVREATVDAMDAIAEPGYIQAQNEVANAQTLLQNADTAINNFVATTGNPSPQSAYNQAQQSLKNFEGLLTIAKINNDTKKIGPLTSTIAAQKQEVTTLGAQLQQFESLSNAKSAALAASDHAQQVLVTAQSLIATDQAANTVSVVNIGRLSKLAEVIKFSAIAFALALLMMLGLILILELMRSSRGTTVPAGAPVERQGAFAWPAAVPPAVASPAEPEAPSPAPASASRDPWRATDPSPPLMSGSGAGASGNGHDNGNGQVNGNGHADPPQAAPAPERAGRGLLRRR